MAETDWDELSSLEEIQSLYSHDKSDKSKFPWDVRNAIGAELLTYPFDDQKLASKRSFFQQLIDGMADPSVLENFIKAQKPKSAPYTILKAAVEKEKKIVENHMKATMDVDVLDIDEAYLKKDDDIVVKTEKTPSIYSALSEIRTNIGKIEH